MKSPGFLNNISDKKLLENFKQTLNDCEVCKNKERINEACQACSFKNKALERYSHANIPVKYWRLNVTQEKFAGPKILLEHFNKLTSNIDQTYNDGKAVLFAGNFGIGKTTVVTNVLKRAVEKGYSALYLTLNDIVSNLVSGGFDDKAFVRNYILKIDFLTIDEFDPRHIGSDSASDLFGRILEDIVRVRFQNNMPTFFCSNNIDAKNAFKGDIKRSLDSLWNYVEEVSLIAKDLRKDGK